MMSQNDYDDAEDMGEGHEHDLAMELTTQSQIFLEMRQQNIELLEMAAKVAGLGGDHPPLKQQDIRQALRTVWEVYSEFYTWVDPEEAANDDEEGDEDEE